MADIVIRGIEVSESLDIIRNGNKIGYSTNNGMTWKDATGFIVLPEEYGRLIDADELMNRARGCLDELTMLSLEFLVNGSNTIVPTKGGGEDGN